jgi:hypothetical protein
MSMPFSAAASYRNKAVLPALVGVGLLVFGFLIHRQQFFLSYLQGYMFALAFPMGCLGLTMVHNLSGGKWGWTIRPFLEAGIKTIPAMSVLFIPIALGLTSIYPWTNHALVAHDAALLSKAGYLNEKFWLIRAVGYFVIWNILGFWLLKWLMPTPAAVKTDIARYHRVQRLSAGGLLVLILSLSFAAIDWVMSIEPHWFSSIFGGIVVFGCAMSAYCWCTMSVVWMHRTTPNPWLTERNLHDLSKFIFMTIMVWGYFNLSQFLIIWSGNLPEETFWYYERSVGGWFWVSTFLPLFQWAFPFCLLLSARAKKNPDFVVCVAWFLLMGRAFEQIWLIAPSARPDTFPIQWLDVVAPIALGATFAALFFGYLGRSSGIPAPAVGPHDHAIGGPSDKPHAKPHGGQH